MTADLSFNRVRARRSACGGLAKATVDASANAAELETGKVFRCVSRAGKHWGDGVTERLIT